MIDGYGQREECLGENRGDTEGRGMGVWIRRNGKIWGEEIRETVRQLKEQGQGLP